MWDLDIFLLREQHVKNEYEIPLRNNTTYVTFYCINLVGCVLIYVSFKIPDGSFKNVTIAFHLNAPNSGLWAGRDLYCITLLWHELSILSHFTSSKGYWRTNLGFEPSSYFLKQRTGLWHKNGEQCVTLLT